MGNAIGEWWRARVPGLVCGAAVGLCMGVLGSFFLHEPGAGPTKITPFVPLGSWAPMSPVVIAENLLFLMTMFAVIGLMSRPSSRVEVLYLYLGARWRNAIGAVRRALTRRSSIPDSHT